MEKPVRIDAFHKSLNDRQEGSVLMSALRKLTDVKSTRDLASGQPSPMGTWSGWSM